MRISQQLLSSFAVISLIGPLGRLTDGVSNKYNNVAKPSSLVVFPNQVKRKANALSFLQVHSALTVSSTATRICVIMANNNGEDIPILFENSSLLAINKPHDIPYHDDPATGTSGIVTLLRNQRLRQTQHLYLHSPPLSSSHQQRNDQEEERLYGVHRLDRVTSGVLLFAKSPRVASMLMKKFANSSSCKDHDDDGIVKFYFGISGKKPTKKKQGWVNGIMVKGRRGSYKLLPTNSGDKSNDNNDTDAVEDDEGRRPAKKSTYASTRFYTAGLGQLPLVSSPPQSSSKCNENDGNEGGGEGQVEEIPKTAILFRPHTGKTHQLRVAAKSLGIPLLGDARYGGGRVVVGNTGMSASSSIIVSSLENGIGSIDRTYLHASAIHFTLEGEHVTIWSPPPFAHLVSSSNNNGKAEKTLLDDVFERMMEKHCDCKPIIDAIHAAQA